MNPTPDKRRPEVVDTFLTTMANLIDRDYRHFDHLVRGAPTSGRWPIYHAVAKEWLPWLAPYVPILEANNISVNQTTNILPSAGRGIIVMWFPNFGAYPNGAPISILLMTYRDGLIYSPYYEEPFDRAAFVNIMINNGGGRPLKTISEKTGDIIDYVYRRSLS